MTNDELRAAAKRYRHPYPRSSASGGKDCGNYWLHRQEYTDLVTLAEAYLAEHPADDDAGVTEEGRLESANAALLLVNPELRALLCELLALAVRDDSQRCYVEMVSRENMNDCLRLPVERIEALLGVKAEDVFAAWKDS